MTVKIPVIFEEGIFKPLIKVPFRPQQKLTFSIRIKDCEDFTHEEWRKIEKLFDESGGKVCRSAKASFDFHKKVQLPTKLATSRL